MSHIIADNSVDYLMKLFSPEEAFNYESHISSCAECFALHSRTSNILNYDVILDVPAPKKTFDDLWLSIEGRVGQSSFSFINLFSVFIKPFVYVPVLASLIIIFLILPLTVSNKPYFSFLLNGKPVSSPSFSLAPSDSFYFDNKDITITISGGSSGSFSDKTILLNGGSIKVDHHGNLYNDYVTRTSFASYKMLGTSYLLTNSSAGDILIVYSGRVVRECSNSTNVYSLGSFSFPSVTSSLSSNCVSNSLEISVVSNHNYFLLKFTDGNSFECEILSIRGNVIDVLYEGTVHTVDKSLVISISPVK